MSAIINEFIMICIIVNFVEIDIQNYTLIAIISKPSLRYCRSVWYSKFEITL